MRSFKQPGKPPTLGAPTGFSRGEKRKLMAMTLGLFLLLIGFLYGVSRQRGAQNRGLDELPVESLELEETVLLPEIDGARLDGLVADSRPIDRVVLESEGLDALLADVRTLTPRHFEAMQTEELDAGRIETILADPAAHRGKPFLARGIVDSVRTRRRTADGEVETIGRLRLEDESLCYFLVLDAPESTEENGGYLRVDGLFLKVYSDEDEVNPGEWIEAPLLVGPRAQRSYRALGEVREPHWAMLASVEDAQLSPRDGSEARIVRETPFDALWNMMAYARDVPADAVDWEAAPELDHEALTRLMEEPAEWRGQPFRIPISRIQDARVKLAGENPARIERYTEGWIGNWNWPNVIHFKSPIQDFDIRLSDFAYGQGFFLHDFAYDSAGRSLRVAPLFVLTSLTRFEPKEDPLWAQLALGFVGLTMALAVLLTFLLLRDRKRSRALQTEMTRRRQARRQRNRPVSLENS